MIQQPESHWRPADRAPDRHLRQFKRQGIDYVLAQILINRGISTPEEARDFLSTRNIYGHDSTFDPRNMPSMSDAVERIMTALRRDERVVVYGDFDADGVTATALLVEALRSMGGTHITAYIPDRVEEGYGLNVEAVQTLAQTNDLMITVDCGIRSVDEVNAANEAGLDVIVTDHHSLGPELPDALAVVNPKRGHPDHLAGHPVSHPHYTEPMIAGVGVAYKLVQALMMAGAELPQRLFERLYDLVAIGTVADIMPLNHLENRVLVQRGLEQLNRLERPGLRALVEVAALRKPFTAQSIAFGIAPRINAAGRLANAHIALDLLLEQDEAQAQRLAADLNELNTERQAITAEAQRTIEAVLEGQDKQPSLIFAADASLQPGIVGLVAGKLIERHYRPSIVVELGDEESRASCRSIPEFDITAALDECADLLVRHGGHALAAGFTVLTDNLEPLRQKLTEKAERQLAGKLLQPTLHIDITWDIRKPDLSLIDDLDRLEPCGHGNPKPVFASYDVHVLDARTVGRDNTHLKLKLDRGTRPPLDAIGFSLGHLLPDLPDRVNIAYELERNKWNGHTALQARLIDVQPSA